MLYQQIDQVQFDLNVTCNAFCPGCHRYTVLDDQMYLNPFLSFNTSLDLEIIEQTMINKRIVDRPWVDFVGLVGDPIAHPKFIEIIDIIYKHKPNAHINIHTNGGLKSPQFFEELATKLKNNQTLLQFSVDGLEDTNNIYRIGVIWEKVMENAKAIVSTGANVTWKCIEFPWNTHQQNEIEQSAKNMNMNFRWEHNRDKGSKRMELYMDAINNRFHKKTPAPINVNPNAEIGQGYGFGFPEIKDRCFDEKSIYINYDGRVLPCCMFNAATTDEQYMKEIDSFIYGTDSEWNNLHTNSLEEVMDNMWWKMLFNSLTTAPCTVCVHSCEKR